MKKAATFSALVGILFGLLLLAEKELSILNLKPLVQGLISVTIGALGVFATQFREQRTANTQHAERVAALDSGMASFTPQLVGEPNLHDLGVQLRGETPDAYIERDIDQELAQAFRAGGSVVVVGARGCGKTRTALQCLAEHSGLLLLVPENAAGLSAMISDLNRDALLHDAKKAGGAVLWLDDLERFLPGLDLDQLDRFQRPGLVKKPLSWWRQVFKRSVFWRGANEEPSSGSFDLPDVRLLATLDEEQLKSPAGTEADVSRTGRRLLARARGIYLADELTVGELARFAQRTQTMAHTTTVSSIFPPEPGAGWQPSVPWERKASGKRSPKMSLITAGLGLITIALAAATVLVGHHLEWTVAPSTTEQVQDIEAALEPCQKGVASPYKDLREGQIFTLTVDSSACPGADELRYYRYHNERLRELFKEAPLPGRGAWSVSCIGPANSPCQFPVASVHLVAAAFREPTRGQLLPLLIYPSGKSDDNAPRIRVPFLPKPPRTKDASASIERHLDMLALNPGAPVDAVPGKTPCVRGELCGYPAEALLALPADPHQHPALLAAGYLAGGSPESPTRLRVEAWEISVPGRGKLAIGKDPCLILDNGLLDTSVRVLPKKAPRAALLGLFENESIDVVC